MCARHADWNIFSTGHCWVDPRHWHTAFIPPQRRERGQTQTLLCIFFLLLLFCITGLQVCVYTQAVLAVQIFIQCAQRVCLALRALVCVRLLETCNHMLQDCFLLSRGVNMMNWHRWRKYIRCHFHQGYFPPVLTFIVSGVWLKYCWTWWWFSAIIGDRFWKNWCSMQSFFIIFLKEELTCCHLRVETKSCCCCCFTLKTNSTHVLKILQH